MAKSDDCQARYQYGNGLDQHVCVRCGYYWDRGDDAPVCKTNEQLGRETLDKLRLDLKLSAHCEHGRPMDCYCQPCGRINGVE
jgi:hypothetical protein